MKQNILTALVLLLFITLGFSVGTKLYTLAEKEAIEFLTPYLLFVVVYIIIAITIIIYRIINRKSIGLVFVRIVLLVVPLIAIPDYFNSKRNTENQKAYEAIENTKYQLALKEINLTIQENPDSAFLYLKRGRIQRGHGLYHESISNCKIALTKGESSDIYWEIGWCYEVLEDYPKAKLAYERAIALDSQPSEIQKRLEIIEKKIKETSH
jgi:tetratricopeptide (TPR) repeat protein